MSRRKATKAKPPRKALPQVEHTTPLRVVYDAKGARVELGYKAAEVIRKSGRRMPTGGSADYHIGYDLGVLRAESQRLDRDNGIYTGTVNRLLDNILGDGFKFQARTDNKRLNQKLEMLWSDFCRSPEVRGMDDWSESERKFLRHIVVDGDCAAIKLDDGQIQIVEAERIALNQNKNAGNNVVCGVEINAVGKPVRFHIAPYSDDGYVESNSTAYDASDVVYVAYRQRISQTRGVPVLVPSFPMFHRINDVCDSEAVAWQLLSRMAVSINRKESEEAAWQTSSEDPSAETTDLATRVHDVGDALIFHGEPGEEIKGIDRNIPGASFPESIKAFMRLLGLPIGFPLELMLLDWSQTNYSSARAALLQAYRMLTRWQRMLMRSFHSPVYEWKVRQWVRQGLIPDRPDVAWHEWFAPPFPWIDPLKDAEADALLTDRGYSSYGEVLKAQNRDREELIAIRATEIREAIATAKQIQAETGTEVPWQLFAGLKASESPAPPAENAAPQGPDPELERIKAEADAYGVAVRAGTVTPQTADEDHFRGKLSLPPMSDDAKQAWNKDKGVRRPITLAPSEPEGGAPVGDEPEPPQPEGVPQ